MQLPPSCRSTMHQEPVGRIAASSGPSVGTSIVVALTRATVTLKLGRSLTTVDTPTTAGRTMEASKK